MRRLLFLLFALLVLTGCQARTKVDVTVEGNGGGVVQVQLKLDKEASANIPDLDRQLRTDDLRARGWDINGPRKDGDFTIVEASHGFDSVEQASALIAQIGPPDGPFKNFKIDQSRNPARVDSKFTGTVDLRRGIESWADPGLAARVGSGLGVDPNEVRNNLDLDLEKAVTVEVAVHLPGADQQRTPAAQDGDTWAIPYGQQTELTASASGWNKKPLGNFAIAAVALIAAILLLLLWKPYIPRHRQTIIDKVVKSDPPVGLDEEDIPRQGGTRFKE